MENISVRRVDTNRHWTQVNLNECMLDNSDRVVIWRGDYAFVEFVVTADVDTDIEVVARHDKALDVQLFRLDVTKAFIGNAGWYARNPKGIMPTGPKVDVDDILMPACTAHIGANGYKCMLAKVSSTHVAGSYNVAFDVLAQGKLVASIDVDVEVLPVDMMSPEDYSFKVEYWHHPYNVAEYYKVQPWSEDHLAIMREQQLFYKALGGSGVICTLLDEVWGGQTYGSGEIRYPSMIKWIYDGSKWSFDYTIFDKWVALNRDIGLDDKFICYSMMPWGNKMRYFHAGKNKYITRIVPTTFKWRYKRAWKVFLNDFIKHLDELGIFDSVYIGFDERSNMNMILNFLEMFSNKDGHHFKVAASFNNYLGNRKCLDRIDSVSVGIDEIKVHEEEYRAIALERQDEGKCTTLYTATDNFPNSFALSEPMESYWSILYAYSTGNNGFLRWAYDAWTHNPLEDTTHWSFQAGDCFLVYPNDESKRPCWSYRLLKLDEAVRDVNKLAKIASQNELAGEICNLLKKIGDNYTYNDVYDSSWGVGIRHAKWLDENGTNVMISDVKHAKSAINDIIYRYSKQTN